jgi:iron(III) transport system substrate-binding protein
MGPILSRSAIGAMLTAALILPAAAAELPAATQKMLKDLKLPTDIMKGIDEELAVPGTMLDEAKREGTVKVLGSWDPPQFAKMVAPFKERYPAIKIEYDRASFNGRAIRPLVAMQEGRYITDVITGFGGSTQEYQAASALEDLRPLPGFRNPLAGTGDPGGTWIGARLRYWCMSYNTDKVKKADLPPTWDGLITNPAWHNGNIGVGARPQLWLLMLWGEYGEKWVDDYMNKFFNVAKPQLRKEGANALLSLAIAGEFNAAIPSAAYRTKQYVDKGAPVSWHCPEPVPLAVSQMGILKGNPHPNAARLWVNWFISKEGQIGQFYGDEASPVHKDLQIEAFLQFTDQINGRKIASRVPEMNDTNDRLFAMWNKYWEGAGGPKVAEEAN